MGHTAIVLSRLGLEKNYKPASLGALGVLVGNERAMHYMSTGDAFKCIEKAVQYPKAKDFQKDFYDLVAKAKLHAPMSTTSERCPSEDTEEDSKLLA